MNSTHHKLRALVKGLGLAFCLATATAALMSAVSSVTPSTVPAGIVLVSATAPAPTAVQQPSADSVLYQRITQTDGSQRWVLLEETQAQAFAPASRDLLMAELPADSAKLSGVSYTLQAKPAGWNRILKDCAQAESGKPLGAAAAYDIACAKLG